MSRTLTAPPRRPIDHPALLLRAAGITGVLFALAAGLGWAHVSGWPAPLLVLAAVVLAAAAGQVLGAGLDSAGADLAAAGLLATVLSGMTVRAMFVGAHSVFLEAQAVGTLGLLVAGGVYGHAALSRLWTAVR
jgi:hypothetical protein